MNFMDNVTIVRSGAMAYNFMTQSSSVNLNCVKIVANLQTMTNWKNVCVVLWLAVTDTRTAKIVIKNN